jgi:hypothetical protein
VRWMGPNGYWASDERELVDVEWVYSRLSREAYWARGRPFELVAKSIEHSLVVGLYAEEGAQVGFARFVTDYATPLPGSATSSWTPGIPAPASALSWSRQLSPTRRWPRFARSSLQFPVARFMRGRALRRSSDRSAGWNGVQSQRRHRRNPHDLRPSVIAADGLADRVLPTRAGRPTSLHSVTVGGWSCRPKDGRPAGTRTQDLGFIRTPL